MTGLEVVPGMAAKAVQYTRRRIPGAIARQRRLLSTDRKSLHLDSLPGRPYIRPNPGMLRIPLVAATSRLDSASPFSGSQALRTPGHQ